MKLRYEANDGIIYKTLKQARLANGRVKAERIIENRQSRCQHDYKVTYFNSKNFITDTNIKGLGSEVKCRKCKKKKSGDIGNMRLWGYV